MPCLTSPLTQQNMSYIFGNIFLIIPFDIHHDIKHPQKPEKRRRVLQNNMAVYLCQKRDIYAAA